jgi:hypothetical protein
LDAKAWRNRLVIVVTNPVELVCQFLTRLTGNPQVYGFGLASDRQRIREALCCGFRVSSAEACRVAATGFHCLNPIPLLGESPHLREKLASMSAEEVTRNLKQCSQAAVASNFWAALGASQSRPSAYALVSAAVAAITASEFRGNAPPVRRGAANLARLLSAVIHRGRVAVSGLGRTGYFLGGTLDLSGGSFRLPDLGGREKDILAQDMAHYDALRRQHLG